MLRARAPGSWGAREGQAQLRRVIEGQASGSEGSAALGRSLSRAASSVVSIRSGRQLRVWMVSQLQKPEGTD